MSPEKPDKDKSGFNLRTESDILEQVKTLEELNQEESEKKDLSSLEKAAQVAFIQVLEITERVISIEHCKSFSIVSLFKKKTLYVKATPTSLKFI